MKSLRIVASAKGCDLADGLLNGAEGGLLHLTAISHVVGRNIRVWDGSGQILGIFGNQPVENEVNYLNKYSSELKKDILEYDGYSKDNLNNKNEYFYKIRNYNENNHNSYLEVQYQHSDNGRIGHWVSKDLEDLSVDRSRSLGKGNDCLFIAICQQCQDYEPEKLRTLTANFIRQKTLVIEDIFPQFQGNGILLLGGAKYEGSSSDDAKQILDDSQGTVGYGHAAKAHPRGHASHSRSTGRIDSVENYSADATEDFPKSAWMSREDQNNDMHKLLMTKQVQDGIARLNLNLPGETRKVIKMDPGFEIQLGLWAGGVMFRGPLRAEFVTILLQHHSGKQDDISADVQVFTCYPMAPRGSEKEGTHIPRNLSMKRSIEPSDDDEDKFLKKLRFD